MVHCVDSITFERWQVKLMGLFFSGLFLLPCLYMGVMFASFQSWGTLHPDIDRLNRRVTGSVIS